MARTANRIAKELQKLRDDGEGLHLEVITEDVWHLSFSGPAGSLYAGEQFTLRFQFTSEYPMDSPIVTFVTAIGVPVHEHIYSNGHICLNILGADWTPAMTVKTICFSIISMLSSATEKKKPHDNDQYVRSKPRNWNPKNTNFSYHDDKV